MGIYESYYDCCIEPFNLSPDPRFLYLSPTHREALAQLRYVVDMRKGFAVLTGEVGLGKTILLCTLLERVGPQVHSAYILKPPRSVPELYATIANDLELGLGGATSAITRLNEFLLEISRVGGTVALIFDEAQQLPIQVLEEIRLLSNIEAPDAKLLQVILAGQPELDRLLGTPKLLALRQRIVMYHTLAPLVLEDTLNYIANRVRIAGAPQSPFTLDACRAIHRLSGGVPRLINLICDKAMLSSYASDSARIDRRCVERVASELQLKAAPATATASRQKRNPGAQRWRGTLAAAGIALLLVLLAAAGVLTSRFYLTNEREHRTLSTRTNATAFSLTALHAELETRIRFEVPACV
ncbi:MAG: AAA family ATPase [Deltaproteobacteria bacterium]|nr:AAA family ATPase [Deltaproteobacteria bacterium]